MAELAAEINPNGNADPAWMTVFKNALYFAATDASGDRELWTLGTTGPATRVANINSDGSSSPAELTVVGDVLYFKAFTPDVGEELWRYDGVTPPSLAADVYPGVTRSFLQYLTAYGNQLVFQADDGQHGIELFTFDTANGLLVKDIEQVSASCPSAPDCWSTPYSLTVYNGVLYFSAFQSDSGFQLYSYDGSSFPRRLTNNIGGATAITGLSVDQENWLIFGGFASGQYRVYSYDIDAATGAATNLSTAIVREPGQFGANGFEPVVYNERVYFVATDGNGEELWASNGTTAAVATDLNPGATSSMPKWLHVFNGELYFRATDPTNGSELRAFDGVAPPRLVKDIVPAASGSFPEAPAQLGQYLVFQAFAPSNRRIWFTDGTASQTNEIKTSAGADLFPEDESFTFFNGALYVNANQQGQGTQLWRISLGALPATTTTLISSLNPAIAGDAITFTATISGANPGGSVTFRDGAAELGTVTVLNGVASLDVSSLSIGSHTITASYLGDGTNAPSTSNAVTQVVNPGATSTVLVSSQNPSVINQAVTFTATVSGGSPTGDVTFFDGATPLALIALVGDSASYTTSVLSLGSHTITARYEGNGTYLGSTSNAVLQTVDRKPTSLTLSSSPNPSSFNELVTFTAVISGANNHGGEVVFSEGAAILATVGIAGNTQAGFTSSTLSVGSHMITATYSGDSQHAGSSVTVEHVVKNSAPPTPPVADPQSVTTAEDTAVGIVLTGDDVNGDPLTFEYVSQPAHGILSGVLPNVTYTPTLNYNGPDSFTFRISAGGEYGNTATVSISVLSVNDPPVTVNDGYTTAEDTPLVVTVPGVMTNDSDVDSSTLTASVVTSTVHGVLTLNPNGSFSYMPMANFFGADGFTYRVSDGQLTSDIVPVSIAVTPVDDVPAAVNDNYTTTEGQALTIAAPGVLANDTDVEASPLATTQAGGPSNGVLTLNGNGSFTYIPGTNFTGSDTFTYHASDGVTPSNAATVTISVVPRTFTWTATGVLGSRRRAHTATLLPSGKVLVAGGLGQGNGVLADAEIYDPVTGTWMPTSSMRVKRAYHTATLLPNGLVLVAGGDNGTRSETYDPATGIWSEAGAVPGTHYRHTATLLPNGKVLVVGGVGNTSTTADLFDPATRTWTITGSLSVGRHIHTATLLPNGKVLAVGGYGTNGGINSAELYDPALGTWNPAASLSTNRTGHSASLLGNGTVLVVGGGNNSNPALATTELFDPITNTWTSGASLATARISHTSTILPGGRILVAGGGDATGAPLVNSEVYDPTTGQWSSTASLIAGRYSHTATLLADGRVLAAGGSGALNRAELYGPVATPVGRWDPAGSMSQVRYGHTATLLSDGRVLVAGGSVDNSAEIFDPVTGAWTTTGSLNVQRSFHTAALMPNGKVLVAGGLSGFGTVIPAEVYDPATGAWTITGSPSIARSNATATLLPANRGVLLAGGSTGSAITNTAETYNLFTLAWNSAGSFTGARWAHGATQLADGRVLLTGGFGSGGNPYLSSAVIYDAAFFTWTDAASMTTRRSRHAATLLPDGTVLVSGGVTKAGSIAASELFDPGTGTWASTGTLGSARANHTATLLPNGKVLVAGGASSNATHQTSELYDPAIGTWSATGNLGAARQFHTATLLPNGKVLVVGGFSSSVAAFATAELYTP